MQKDENKELMKEVVGYKPKEKRIKRIVIIDGWLGTKEETITVCSPIYKDHGGNDHLPPTSFESSHWNLSPGHDPDTLKEN